MLTGDTRHPRAPGCGPHSVYWFDMVRVDNGMIQEHWDAAVKNPPAPARGAN